MSEGQKPKDLGEALDRAALVGAALHDSTVELNNAIKAAERGLADLKLGVTASVRMPAIPGDDIDWYRLLVFMKFDNEWRLVFSQGSGDDDWEEQPLLNASREVRLAAVDLVPSLASELVVVAEKQAVRAAQKAKELNSFIDKLTKRLPS